MKFNKQDLLEMLDDDSDKLMRIDDVIIAKSRWALHHRVLFSFEGKFYRSYYDEGATEYQEERPWEHDDDMVECEEVIRTPTITYKYEPIVNNNTNVKTATPAKG